ncbi:SPOR domain-containing protein [Thermodesulfobacteriota bacterium]
MPKTRKKPKKYKIELTTISAMFWGVFLFVLLTWIFVLGILVGRGFLPGTVSTISNLKNQVKRLQEMVGKKDEYKGIESVNQEKDPEMAFYEKLNSKKDEIKKTTLPENKEKTPDEITLFKEPPEKKTTKEITEKAITETAKENVKTQREAPGEKEALRVKTPPVSDSSQQYTVQIAATGDKEKAEELIKTLVEQGHDAYYYMAEVKGNNLYRVRCGRFPDRKSALEYSGKLEKETGHKGFVSKAEQ